MVWWWAASSLPLWMAPVWYVQNNWQESTWISLSPPFFSLSVSPTHIHTHVHTHGGSNGRKPALCASMGVVGLLDMLGPASGVKTCWLQLQQIQPSGERQSGHGTHRHRHTHTHTLTRARRHLSGLVISLSCASIATSSLLAWTSRICHPSPPSSSSAPPCR